MAETGKMKTYSDAIEAILSKSVILSPELLGEVDSFTKDNTQLGYTTKEEFILDAVRSKLASLSDNTKADPNPRRCDQKSARSASRD
jgi:metal-responsive CopG/Arc/MetJ family transcriptional regulator